MMKYFVYILNILLVLAIPAVVITARDENVKRVETTIEVKKINSLKLTTKEESLEKLPVNSNVVEEVEEQEEIQVEEKEEKEEEKKIEDPPKEEIPEVVEVPKKEEPVKEPEKPVSDVLQTLVGNLSGYGPDCYLCSGYTSSGHNANESIYYNDERYGSLRILAGDRSLKLGSIVRVKSSRLGEFLGIVLDRGSDIGIGKKHLFDLLFPSEKEASKFGVSYNTTFEILRNGY